MPRNTGSLMYSLRVQGMSPIRTHRTSCASRNLKSNPELALPAQPVLLAANATVKPRLTATTTTVVPGPRNTAPPRERPKPFPEAPPRLLLLLLCGITGAEDPPQIVVSVALQGLQTGGPLRAVFVTGTSCSPSEERAKLRTHSHKGLV